MSSIVSFREVNTVVKNKIESVLVGAMAISVVVIVALMPLHAFVSTWLGTSIGPLLVWKSWKEILLALMIPLVAWFCALRPDIARAVWGRLVNKLIGLYLLLHLTLALVSKASAEAVVAGLLMNLRFLAIFVLVQVIVEARPYYVQRLKNVIPRWLLWVGLGLGALALLQVYVLPRDFFVQFGYNKDITIAPYILVDQNPNVLRAFATMRGPNTLGAYLLLPLAAALYLIRHKRHDLLGWATIVVGFVAVYLTGSRSAWLGLLTTIVVLALLIVPRHRVAYWAKRLIVPAIILVALVGWAAVSVPRLRLAIFHSSPGDISLTEGSNDKHWEATKAGIIDVVRHPLGSGPGSAGPASFYNTSGPKLAEDYYVQIAQEIGLVGLGLFLWINFLTLRRIVRHSALLPSVLVASFAGISLVNLFLHGWADDPTALTWWALAGLYMGKTHRNI